MFQKKLGELNKMEHQVVVTLTLKADTARKVLALEYIAEEDVSEILENLIDLGADTVVMEGIMDGFFTQ
jgi:hypothetical protein